MLKLAWARRFVVRADTEQFVSPACVAHLRQWEHLRDVDLDPVPIPAGLTDRILARLAAEAVSCPTAYTPTKAERLAVKVVEQQRCAVFLLDGEPSASFVCCHDDRRLPPS